jgi:hypothetical protein
MPMMLEQSIQAQFLIPTVVSLSFGVLAATFVTLILVPAMYLAGEDLIALVRRILRMKQVDLDPEVSIEL